MCSSRMTVPCSGNRLTSSSAWTLKECQVHGFVCNSQTEFQFHSKKYGLGTWSGSNMKEFSLVFFNLTRRKPPHYCNIAHVHLQQLLPTLSTSRTGKTVVNFPKTGPYLSHIICTVNRKDYGLNIINIATSKHVRFQVLTAARLHGATFQKTLNFTFKHVYIREI
jgi:hypothetical protein